MKTKLRPVYCKKCDRKLLDGVMLESETYCKKCDVWTKQEPEASLEIEKRENRDIYWQDKLKY